MSPATPFTKVLVANRGEIALRVMRSARKLGYRTVAVYSTADACARHVLEADQAICIGEPAPARSYLDIAAIVDAAHACGADAVHPGYGFLAENEHFAAACREAGLVFVGPSARAIAAMGNKALAKSLMREAGVPCIPGYQGEDQGGERLLEEAKRIGFPVMIKAIAGGGGRGMRLARSATEFPALLASARSEAQGAFGNAQVLLERAIGQPRHVEIQVFADRHGQVIHLGERDCSVQRRHQKLVEEAPSPAVDADLRSRMGATAVAAARAIDYEGAGTFEFLLDARGEYYFMEANTRLQVEHPVTEETCGIDLVEWQLRVAAGERLPLGQEEVRHAGHAIEVRLCAEDVAAGFLPRSGILAAWRAPAGLRVEHALASGVEIVPHYDSMIAKIVSRGANREEARRKLVLGLEELVALGVATNQRFLARCLEHPVFVAGNATTAFVADHQDELVAEDPALQERAIALAAVLFAETGDARTVRRGGALAHRLPIMFTLAQGTAARAVSLARSACAPVGFGAHLPLGRPGDRKGRSAARFRVETEGRHHEVDLLGIDADRARFAFDRVEEGASFMRDGRRLHLSLRGAVFTFDDMTRARSEAGATGAVDGNVRASMNGRVVAVTVAAGERVAAGQALVTVEAMKMEHSHVAPAAGTVGAVAVSVGDQVTAGRVLVQIAHGEPESVA